MKYSLSIVVSILMLPFTSFGQLISIYDARSLPLGSTVTINGIVTSGAEFGTIRYLQDGTAGIAVFSSALATTVRGDNVTVTGVTVDYQNLLEITPVNSWNLNSSGNPMPAPVLATPSQLNENYESIFIQINNVTFTNPGSTFAGNVNYNFTANGQNGVVYIRSTNPLVGQTIPSSNITLYGLCSQFGNQYQVLPRDLNDLVSSSSILITVPPYPQNITTSGLDIAWNTNINGNTFIRYGNTPNLELGVINGPANSSAPVINISGASASELFYVQSFSVSGNDTAYSNIRSYITASNSSGDIKVYFNRPVDTYVATPSGNNAILLNNTFDDTLKAYIDRSIATLDIAIYSFDDTGTGLIVQAVNDAYNRGVQVRVIADGSNTNAGLQLLNSAIPVLLSPTVPFSYYGIMHNKFFILDAEHTNANKPVVMGGSTNWSNGQLYDDRNNLVFIQDKSLALVYQMEFEEMWGGIGAQPNLANSKFGPDKTDNTPHELNIGGKRIECFFSPSDNANSQIIKTMQSADQELYFATLVFTRFDLAYAVEERVDLFGVSAAGIMDDSSGGSGTSFLIMQGVMGNNIILFDHGSNPGILHHKYLIVDPSNSSSDPTVLTGSHNWSNSANLKNDENILVIHDPAIANQFYQEFHNLFNGNGGAVGSGETLLTGNDLTIYPNPSNGNFKVVFNSTKNVAGTILITEISGRVVYSTEMNNQIGVNEIQLNKTLLSKGVYFLTLQSPEIRKTTKLIIN
ncbi:MAG: T9SS type A sorting domain-containing protein [Bacteroidetes bacterium]|nr:T9SS type A sorting domain-containing protein [Bacteroidota bacterium]